MRIAILDDVHPIITQTLNDIGYKVDMLSKTSLEEFIKIIPNYDGLIIRSRFKINSTLLSKAIKLKFIGRPGAGLENIDLDYCYSNNISVFRSPEGNMDAVGEHAIAMLLSLFNKLRKSTSDVKKGRCLREENRGVELKGKTVGIMGYGFMGSAFAKKLSGFGVKVIAFDKYKTSYSDEYVKEVSMTELYNQTDILSIHTPLTRETIGLVNKEFIENFKNSIYIINTARGNTLVTKDLVELIESNKVLGACLDVLDYENSSFEFLDQDELPESLEYLLNSDKTIITPHIAGWTHESKFKMGKVLVEKIITFLNKQEKSQ